MRDLRGANKVLIHILDFVRDSFGHEDFAEVLEMESWCLAAGEEGGWAVVWPGCCVEAGARVVHGWVGLLGAGVVAPYEYAFAAHGAQVWD